MIPPSGPVRYEDAYDRSVEVVFDLRSSRSLTSSSDGSAVVVGFDPPVRATSLRTLSEV